MRALSIRQPFAELILRGIKTAELRSRATSIIGERFYIYAAKGHSSLVTRHLSGKQTAWSGELTAQQPPAWMIELAEQVKMIEPEAILPTGVIVGTAVIERVTPPDPAEAGALFRWHLVNVERAKKLRTPKGRPQPVWFKPF